jgi:PiT family inorganic phosphate transporter
VAIQPDGGIVLQATGVALSVGQLRQCVQRYHGRIVGFDSQGILDGLHLLSAGAMSFARGLNDTPKIAALLVTAQAMGVPHGMGLVAVGVAMAAGGLVHVRRVAITMSERITPMNHGQGLTANLVTSLLVIGASCLGMPVSTTHVSCGSLFGLGAITGRGRWNTARLILLAWFATLPVAAAIAVATYAMLQHFSMKWPSIPRAI